MAVCLLIVLPFTDRRKCRFESFLCSVISLHTQSIDLEKVISERRKYLMVVSFLFLFIACGFWLLPIYFVCLTCDLLESHFDELYKQMTSLRSMDLPAFRVKHNTSCDLVELADKILSPLLLLSFSLYIPFLCFNLYQIANLPE